MAYKLLFKRNALDKFDRLDPAIQKRILKKLMWFAKQDDPICFAHPLTNSMLGDFRFRIGDWRVVFDLNGTTIVILLIGKRSEIYR